MKKVLKILLILLAVVLAHITARLKYLAETYITKQQMAEMLLKAMVVAAVCLWKDTTTKTL